jgi:hypothetical protein
VPRHSAKRNREERQFFTEYTLFYYSTEYSV